MYILAFRLLGTFEWPPKAHGGDAPVSGLLEIWYAQNKAFLRWAPGKINPSQPHGPDFGGLAAAANVYDVPHPQTLFSSDHETLAWISAPAGKKGERLYFRGASWLEQFNPNNQPDAYGQKTAQLAWPLARICTYADGEKNIYSSVVIGQTDNDLIRLNLQLPTPFPQTNLPTRGEHNPPVLPFSALYPATVISGDDIGLINTLVLGAVGRNGQTVQVDDAHFHVPARERRLGGFGFCKSYPANSGRFVNLPSGVNAKNFWPIDAGREVAIHAFRRFGFEVGDARLTDFEKLEFRGAEPKALSVRFPDPKNNRHKLVYRVSLKIDNRYAALKDGEDTGWSLVNGEKSFEFAFEGQLGGVLRAASDTIDIDLVFSWRRPDKTFWTAPLTSIAPKLELQLSWDETFGVGPLSTRGSAATNIYSHAALADAALAMLGVRDALRYVEGAEPRTFLPALSVEKPNQKVRFELSSQPIDAAPREASLTAASSGPTLLGQLAFRRVGRPPMRLSIGKPDPLLVEHPTALSVIAKFSQFLNDRGEETAWKLKIQRGEEGEGYFASYELVWDSDPPKANARLAALDFRALGAGAEAGKLFVGGPGSRPGSTPATAQFMGKTPVAIDFTLLFSVGVIKLQGVDVPRGDRTEREAPLLIALGDGRDNGKFGLKARERVWTPNDRLLEVDIIDTSGSGASRDYVVLSREPFALARISEVDLGARGDAGNATVASYSSDDRIWTLKRTAEYYHYTLPPQVVGESADKPRRLELHDAPSSAGGAAPIRPYDDPPQGSAPGAAAQWGAVHRRAVEFRLTPPAEIWVRPSDVERGYVPAAWNSNLLFRQRGELGLGTALAALRAEFLYGMPVGIDVSREQGFARQARVAEIEALLGRVVPGPVNASASDPLSLRWAAVSRAIERRPERLEIWAQDPTAPVAFAPARFAAGVSFALRRTALHRAPVPGADGEFEAPRDVERAPQGDRLRYHPQGLSGGALWPVESGNLFRALRDKPESDGGSIEGLALSPIGGDAYQTAEFLGGLVTIISQTRNGFVERQQVEVLGRIGVFWHRAKHVVVYQRTVDPTAQFAPRKAEDPNGTRSRRPILRKVREYVELLQPERRYPDMPGATQRNAGFLEAVRFNSKIINVDSAWSRDVDKHGWEIPLWNRQGARERPQVYPMPDIAFVTTAEGEEERPVVAQECLDPDNLFFFADFTSGKDTDAWNAHPGIDLAYLPPAVEVARKIDARIEASAEQRKPSVSRFMPGAKRFTWRLAPAARKTALNAGRSPKPVFVALDTITFMRPGSAKDTAKRFGDLLIKGDAINDAKPASLPTPDFWPKGGASDGRKGYADAIDAVIKAAEASSPDSKTITEALKALKNELSPASALQTSLTSAVNGVLSNADFQKYRKEIAALDLKPYYLDDPAKKCDELKSNAKAMLQGKSALVFENIRAWERDTRAFLSQFPTKVNKQEIRNAAAKDILALVQPVFDEASADVARAQRGVEAARAVVSDAFAGAEETVEKARGRVTAFASAYERDKPWSANRRKEFSAGLRAGIANVKDDVTGVVDEARQRFAAELGQAAQSAGGHLARAMAAIDAGEAAALSEANDVGALLTTPVTFPFDAILAKIADARAKIQAGGEDAALKQKALDAIDAAKGVVDGAKANLSAAVDKVRKVGGETIENSKAALTELSAALKAQVVAVKNGGDALVKAATDLSALGFGSLLAFARDIEAGALRVDARVNAWTKAVAAVGDEIDLIVGVVIDTLDATLSDIRALEAVVKQQADAFFYDAAALVGGLQDALAPGGLAKTVIAGKVIGPALDTALRPFPGDIDLTDLTGMKADVERRLATVSEEARAKLNETLGNALEGMESVDELCKLFGDSVHDVKDYFKKLENSADGFVKEKVKAAQDYCTNVIDGLVKDIGADPSKVKALIAAVQSLDASVRGIQNDVARVQETGRAYVDRVTHAFAGIDPKDPYAIPGRLLDVYSAVTSSPELAALQSNIDRMRGTFDDAVNVTKQLGVFAGLGDSLKGLGVSFEFTEISDRLKVCDPSNFDIGAMFNNLGGGKLRDLFKDYKLPKEAAEHIHITHDFDKKQGRAWAQIDVDLPLDGRRSLFSLEVFTADLVDLRLTGRVRIEASKDSQSVSQTGFGRLAGDLDMVVSGQSMVTFQSVALNFMRESGLKVDFDPSRIKLNPSFQFIQDLLKDIIPDELGGLKVVKRDGLPIGLEHEFALPPISLMFGTSGVQNLSISNSFRFLAFPDFSLADRFCLARPEVPFIFSFFILGGTGYIQIEADYKPFNSELMVSVEAAAGGSASIGFAFGPVAGSVFIALSVSLTYRKLIGAPGGGLTIGVVLVVSGNVTVCGIVSIGIYLLLRMSYNDGQVDADGTLSVTIRISRFFKISARADVHYKLRGGRSETVTSTSTSVESPQLAAAEKLKNGRV